MIGNGNYYQPPVPEARALSKSGAIRCVPAKDLHDDAGRPGDVRHGDLERLRSAGLIRTVTPLDREGRTTLVTLTDRGREVLESHRKRGAGREQQAYYAGEVKLRELSHDAELYRAYLRVAERLQDEGSRVHRIVLDYELKRDYQRFLQAPNRNRSD